MDGAEHAGARGDAPAPNAEGVTEVTGAQACPADARGDRAPARTAGTRKMCSALPPPHAADQAAAVLVAQAKAQREAKLGPWGLLGRDSSDRNSEIGAAGKKLIKNTMCQTRGSIYCYNGRHSDSAAEIPVKGSKSPAIVFEGIVVG